MNQRRADRTLLLTVVLPLLPEPSLMLKVPWVAFVAMSATVACVGLIVDDQTMVQPATPLMLNGVEPLHPALGRVSETL
jgi:hypothetical protein